MQFGLSDADVIDVESCGCELCAVQDESPMSVWRNDAVIASDAVEGIFSSLDGVSEFFIESAGY